MNIKVEYSKLIHYYADQAYITGLNDIEFNYIPFTKLINNRDFKRICTGEFDISVKLAPTIASPPNASIETLEFLTSERQLSHISQFYHNGISCVLAYKYAHPEFNNVPHPQKVLDIFNEISGWFLQIRFDFSNDMAEDLEKFRKRIEKTIPSYVLVGGQYNAFLDFYNLGIQYNVFRLNTDYIRDTLLMEGLADG